MSTPTTAAPPLAGSQTSTKAASSRAALAALSLATLLASFGTSAANVALPTLAHAFAATFPQVQWVVLAYLLMITSLSVGAGRLGDLLGRRRLLLAGIALFTLASLASGLAQSIWQLIGARAVQGAGAAVMMALALALAAESVPSARLGRTLGLLGAMSAVGTAVGPSLGGALIAGWGWRAIFLINLPLGITAWVLARGHLPAVHPKGTPARPRFAFGAIVILTLALLAAALATTAGGGRFALSPVMLLGVALLMTLLFVRIEQRSSAPLLPLAIIRDPELRAGLFANALVATVVMATLVVGPFFLARTLGLAPAVVGLVMSTGPLVAALVGLPAGTVVDRLGAARAAHAGLITLGVGSGLLAALGSRWGLYGYVAALMLLTAGYAQFQAANSAALLARSGGAQRGVASGLLQLSRNLGLVAGASLMGMIFASAAGHGDPAIAPASAIDTGTRITFSVTTALTFIALLLLRRARPDAWRRDERRNRLFSLGFSSRAPNTMPSAVKIQLNAES